MSLMCIRNRRARPATEQNMQTGSAKRRGVEAAGGFTLLELMIVVAIMMILIGIAAGMYQRSVQRAKEATLRSDLTVMPQAIEHYTLDQQTTPQAPEGLGTP